MGTPRSNALTQIMQIETQVTQITRSKRYRNIQQSIRDLKNSSGKSIIQIQNPNETGETLQIRKNSPTAKEHLKTYELQLHEYEVLFTQLRERKNKLKTQLFG